MIAEHGERGAVLEHVSNDDERFADARASIDEVADEHRDAVAVAIRAPLLAVVHSAKELFELLGVAVDVTDHVVAGRMRVDHRSRFFARVQRPD